jgi:hypothetical protein
MNKNSVKLENKAYEKLNQAKKLLKKQKIPLIGSYISNYENAVNIFYKAENYFKDHTKSSILYEF